MLKNNIFELDEKTFKQVCGTAIGTKFSPLYTILFKADVEEKIISDFIHRRHFLVGKHGEKFQEKIVSIC